MRCVLALLVHSYLVQLTVLRIMMLLGSSHVCGHVACQITFTLCLIVL
jgi:hypothetical protein